MAGKKGKRKGKERKRKGKEKKRKEKLKEKEHGGLEVILQAILHLHPLITGALASVMLSIILDGPYVFLADLLSNSPLLRRPTCLPCIYCKMVTLFLISLRSMQNSKYTST